MEHRSYILIGLPLGLLLAIFSGIALAEQLRDLGYLVRRRKDPTKALKLARELAGSDGLVVVTGSLFAVGDMLAILERAKKKNNTGKVAR